MGAALAAAARPGSVAAAAAAAAARQPDATVMIRTTMNNIHACVSNLEGDVVARSSGGLAGFKHRQRASGAAAKDIGVAIAKKAAETGHRIVHVHMKGPARGRAQVLRGIQEGGLRVYDIKDVTALPTGGCRPPAMRRL